MLVSNKITLLSSWKLPFSANFFFAKLVDLEYPDMHQVLVAVLGVTVCADGFELSRGEVAGWRLSGQVLA